MTLQTISKMISLSLILNGNRIKIKRSRVSAGSSPPGKGHSDYFKGLVHVYPLYSPPEPSRVMMELSAFQPGARTAWHSHPLGQTLIITAGSGWAQREGGPVEDIRQGDVVYFSPHQKHWHGASATTGMSHISIEEKINGSAVDWMEQVTDFEYKRDKNANS
jgi:quercetin dioxygenase-like cupin family protein